MLLRIEVVGYGSVVSFPSASSSVRSNDFLTYDWSHRHVVTWIACKKSNIAYDNNKIKMDGYRDLKAL